MGSAKKTRRWLAPLLVSLLASTTLADLVSDFKTPPPEARPWVYWFWNNGNVTKAGITADLEAMQRVGVGGVIIMDVVERFAPPPGTADFMNPEWQSLFQFSVEEAHRLGLEINMTNGPGWCGSSGPWVTPQLSMQKLVSSSATIEGGANPVTAPPPAKVAKRETDTFNSVVPFEDFYRDVAVLAYPAPENGAPVKPEAVIDLTSKLGADGKLDWSAPAGKWIIHRIGTVSTGSSTRPPVKGGNGLEIDKLSAAAMDLHFDQQMGKLIAAAGKMAGPTLSATHIDSWEVGAQNWTPLMREEFKKRRGYDPLPYLPNVITKESAHTIGNPVVAERFKWDYDQTCAELLADNYVGQLAKRAHEYGLRLTMEGYDLPFGDEATYTSRVDEPMSEFWTGGGNQNERKARQMASVAHVMGQKIVGAEAFTSGDREQWKLHPASVKAGGDYQFSQGINRFVIHRYAHQPYLDKFPGATMGPWGLHYERTNTWWEMSGAWHAYLARCQEMLRQGLFVADVCYLRPEWPNQTYLDATPALPSGYRYDEISAEALIARMSVKDGRLTLPDGMSYKLLVLPPAKTMTPALAQKIKQLVNDGATIYGPKPEMSPSLMDYPKCDQEVAAIGNEVWGDVDWQPTTKDRTFGKGHVYFGMSITEVLKALNVAPDFQSTAKLNWIHRDAGEAQVYFVANASPTAVETVCTFRAAAGGAERWNPETGETTPIVHYEAKSDAVSMPLRLEGSGSAFIVIRKDQPRRESVLSITRDGQPIAKETLPPKLTVVSASYGVPGDAARMRDVKDKLQKLLDEGEAAFPVTALARGDDPAYGIVKTLDVEYLADGKSGHFKGKDTDQVALKTAPPAPERPADVTVDAQGGIALVAREPGVYELKMGDGTTRRADVSAVPPALSIDGPWQVEFTKGWGAADSIRLDRLISLSESPDDGVRHFSGTIQYTKTFDFGPTQAATEWTLDLGEVQVMAQVSLNGTELGTLWNPPLRLDSPAFRSALKAGRNTLVVRVANLWPNRMIADAALPPEKRLTWSSYEPFKPDSPLLRSGLIGPVRLVAAVRSDVH